MKISLASNTPAQCPMRLPGKAAAESGPAPAADGYVPGATAEQHMARVRCQKAIGKTASVIGAVGLGALGAAAGTLVACPILGGVVGGLLGARLGYKFGYAQAAKLHDSSADKPLTSWKDPAPTTPEQAAQFQSQITDLQHKLLDSGKITKLERGFHMKQNWGGKAHLDFDADMNPELRAGLLSDVAGKSVNAAVRFSNGQGCPFQDGKPDVRGVGIKLDIDGKEDDWLATNHVTFAKDAEQFMKFAAVSATMQTDGPFAALKDLVHRIRHDGYRLGEAARIAYNIASDTIHPNKHVATETYWTQAMHVGNLTGRFVITPESGAVSKPPLFGKDHDFLRKNMEKDLEAGPVKMHVGFEAFTEDSPATGANQRGEHVTYNVGTLVFDQRKADSEERKFEEETVGKMAFNPIHGNSLAGPINESNRGKIYEQSAKNRGAVDFSSAEVQAFFSNKNV